MMAAGVPVIPGSKEAIYDVETGAKIAEEIGYPVIIKAALGGGGKGMRVAQTAEEFEASFQTAQKESQMAFGDNTMYIEHFVQHPRHIEFQILADSYGNVIHLASGWERRRSGRPRQPDTRTPGPSSSCWRRTGTSILWR